MPTGPLLGTRPLLLRRTPTRPAPGAGVAGPRPAGAGRTRAGRDVPLFAAAAALVALHGAVDAFLAPEPGTSAGDHLLAGLVPIGLVAAAALAYPRLVAGARAALAATLGVLALEAAGLAVASAADGGARAEDWSGFALAPAGVALTTVAAGLLWRSRKPHGRRLVRRTAIGLAAVLAAYWLVAPVAIGVLATHRPRGGVDPPGLGRPYEAVSVTTADGLELAGWYVRSRNGAAVVSYPTRAGQLPEARMLVRHGYGVLLLDARGYDGSEGDANAFGWAGTKDVDAAVAWLRRQPDVRDGRIGGIGFSVGGEVLLEAAAANPGLRAVVSEGAGVRSVRESVLRGPRGWLSLPEAAVQTAAVAVLSGTAPPPALDDVLAGLAPRRALLVYAGRGGGGEELNPEYARAGGGAVTLWEIPEARHVGGYEARPGEYERRVTGFLDAALLR